MLAISRPAYCSMSESMEEPTYTDLQPVTVDNSYLITSSNDPCLPDLLTEVSCVEWVVQSEDTFSTEQQGCCSYTLPDSPVSLIEDDCSISEEDLLQTRLYEESQVYDEEDDDASVMLDFIDLSFLDEESLSEAESGEEGGYGHSFMDSLDACPTVIVKANPGANIPEFHRQFTPSPTPLTPTPSPSSSPTHTPASLTPLCPTSTSAATAITIPTVIANIPCYSSSTAATTLMTLHYNDLPTTIRAILDPEAATADDAVTVSLFPPSPPDSTGSPVMAEMDSSSTQTADCTKQEWEEEEEEEGGGEGGGRQREREERTCGADGHTAAVDFDSFDNSDDDDDDEDAGYKPYCGSRRGAKKNLLWKFLLWSLDHHSDVVCWTDVEKGIFKFMDTTRVSTLWGQRKHKTDMTFEKLSRGIRHYYKRGLMERLSHTRLMYKFNWDKVPRKYRKA